MRKKIRYLLLLLVPAFIIYSCVHEFDDSDSLESQRLLTEAKAWYEQINDPVVILKTSADEESDFAVMPDWKHFFTGKNNKYEVAEMELLTKHRFSVVDKTVGEKYRATKDIRYRNSSIRLVYRKDKETGNVYGFYMNIVPEAGFDKSKTAKIDKIKNSIYSFDIQHIMIVFN